jgi:hypothetical protein
MEVKREGVSKRGCGTSIDNLKERDGGARNDYC